MKCKTDESGCECKEGYDYDGTNCTLIDEPVLESQTIATTAPCVTNQNCPNNSVCRNSICTCMVGYAVMGNAIICDDVDECEQGTHNCPGWQNCVNTVGSFQCISK